MNNIFKIKILTMFFIVVVLFTGCSSGSTTESKLSLLKRTDPEPTVVGNSFKAKEKKVEKVKDIVYKFPEIYDVAVIKNKNDIIVAYKVKHLQRFQMKKIQKRIKTKLEKTFPNENIIISSDYKIFLEVAKLNELLLNDDLTEEEARKKFNNIVKLTREET